MKNDEVSVKANLRSKLNRVAVAVAKILIINLYIIRDTYAVIPAQAGIQQDKNAFCSNPLDSRLRGNDVIIFSFS